MNLTEATIKALRGKLTESECAPYFSYVAKRDIKSTLDDLLSGKYDIMYDYNVDNFVSDLQDYLKGLNNQEANKYWSMLQQGCISAENSNRRMSGTQPKKLIQALKATKDYLDGLNSNIKKENKSNNKMTFEDWIDYIDIVKEYPDWFEDKSELDRPFLDVIDDHMEELERDYKKYMSENKSNNKMTFEDWIDYIDIVKEYPDWFEDKSELDRPFLDVIDDHMEELERDYKKYMSENKKVTEASLTVDEILDEYKKAYGKDLDLKTVPCVIARDKMLSGWGRAEGKNHYQVVLCGDREEAENIEYNMQVNAKREQLANVRLAFGIKSLRLSSVSYVVGRNARAWNMGDKWYERYDNKTETKNIKADKGSLSVTPSIARQINSASKKQEDLFNKATTGEIEYGIYDDKDDRNLKDRYKEPTYAKRNKIRNFDNKAKSGSFRDNFNKEVTHVDYEKMPNKKSTAYKVGKDLGWIEKSKKTENDDSVRKYTVTLTDGENTESFEFYADKSETFEDVYNEIYSTLIF